jgi:hypothetical protein
MTAQLKKDGRHVLVVTRKNDRWKKRQTKSTQKQHKTSRVIPHTLRYSNCLEKKWRYEDEVERPYTHRNPQGCPRSVEMKP